MKIVKIIVLSCMAYTHLFALTVSDKIKNSKNHQEIYLQEGIHHFGSLTSISSNNVVTVKGSGQNKTAIIFTNDLILQANALLYFRNIQLIFPANFKIIFDQSRSTLRLEDVILLLGGNASFATQTNDEMVISFANQKKTIYNTAHIIFERILLFKSPQAQKTCVLTIKQIPLINCKRVLYSITEKELGITKQTGVALQVDNKKPTTPIYLFDLGDDDEGYYEDEGSQIIPNSISESSILSRFFNFFTRKEN